MQGTSGVRRNRAYMDQINTQVQQPDDEWVWGNHRGGGGAPVRDTNGNNVSNLKGIVPNHDQRESGRGRRDWSPELQETKPKPKGGRRFHEEVRDDQEEDTFEDIALPRRQQQGGRQLPPAIQPRAVPKLGSRGSGYQNEEEELIIPGLNNRMNASTNSNHHNSRMNSISPGNSPKKFMSAIQEMNSSITNQEKQAKNKRELEYQAALRKQIEEKQRQKNEEKRKDDEIKRREYEEFMRHAQPGYNMPPASKQQPPPIFKESRQNNSVDYSKSKGNKHVPGLDLEAEDDEEQEQQYYNRRGSGGRKGGNPSVVNSRHQQPSRSVYNQDDDEDESAYTPPRRHRPQQHHQESVPAEKYDELTALCEKLMRQQEELQAEIHQQASVIKELQKGKGSNNGAAQLMRSKSVQQPRPTPASEGRSSSVERRRINAANDSNSNKQRPSSMYAAPVGRIPNELPFKKHNHSAAEQKKQLKVAFGGSVMNGEKKLSAAPSTASNVNSNKQQQQQGPKANKSTGDLLAHKRNPANNGNLAGNGFAKLQLKTTGGPRVVSYEDDEAVDIHPARHGNSNGSAMQGSMNLELRGQSKYVSVVGGSEDEVSGDQLDRLLAGTRRHHGGY